ncbi:MAG: hypothetical protein KZQ93_09540 [Candidatus Thiodiazotropha sp. (ex Monitilora ramsayi)]|nr:hypothetical protein [Candidatus Thiodiazotropha sp. (ex Monitilora ramsayi)]
MDNKAFMDRLAIGFLNLVVGLLTGSLLWLVLNGFPVALEPWLPAHSILWFTGVMVVLGILRQEVIFLGIYSACWRFVYNWFRWY